MTSTNADEALTVTCPGCDGAFSVEMTSRVERTDYNPDGVVDADCGRCGRNFAVGFQRRGGSKA
ncbi:hypothetical protein C474_09072 [Halogeometricum pallidum JCM 14848]|uniref:Uncharacterized protein n=1 Tax=Halogeometricum pallidum JCM 14848 TaxID=1227487 RepID=M0D7H0_HALPD|nr:hypothetical protein [Halogeometricum pallidum]ELZ31440.1 hypothetical protein C474_09072 [Halogeometricum pallidum JCM 14848]